MATTEIGADESILNSMSLMVIRNAWCLISWRQALPPEPEDELGEILAQILREHVPIAEDLRLPLNWETDENAAVQGAAINMVFEDVYNTMGPDDAFDNDWAVATISQ
jgi:hypothetical protein